MNLYHLPFISESIMSLFRGIGLSLPFILETLCYPAHIGCLCKSHYHNSDTISTSRCLKSSVMQLFFKSLLQRTKKHQSSALLALCKGNHRWPTHPYHQWPVMRKAFLCHDVVIIMASSCHRHHRPKGSSRCLQSSRSARVVKTTKWLSR